jgi:hypothetical protein
LAHTWNSGDTVTAALLNDLEGRADQGVTANTGLASKVNSSTYTAGLAGKADLVGGTVPDAQLPSRLSDASLKAAIDAEAPTILGSATNPVTNAAAARPSGLTKVFWQCATQPTNWASGDEWINNS